MDPDTRCLREVEAAYDLYSFRGWRHSFEIRRCYGDKKMVVEAPSPPFPLPLPLPCQGLVYLARTRFRWRGRERDSDGAGAGGIVPQVCGVVAAAYGPYVPFSGWRSSFEIRRYYGAKKKMVVEA